MVACSPAHRAQRKRRQKAQNESTTSSSSSDEERFERRKNKSMSKARNRYLSYFHIASECSFMPLLFIFAGVYR